MNESLSSFINRSATTFFRTNLRKLHFPSPQRTEKRHHSINNPKFQEELSLDNEHASDNLFGHLTLESWKLALSIIYKNNKIPHSKSHNLYEKNWWDTAQWSIIYLNSAEFPNWHFPCFTIVSGVERQAKKYLDHQVQVHQKTKTSPIPGQSFLVEIDDKGIIGCNQNIETHIKLEIWNTVVKSQWLQISFRHHK